MRIKKHNSFIFLFLVIISLLLFGDIFAYADDKPTFIISETVNEDNTVYVSVYITPDVSAAGTIKLKYQSDLLELQSAERGSSDAQIINVNANQEGIVSMNFLNAQGAVGEDNQIAVIKFSLKSESFSEKDIYSEDFKLYNIDSQLISDNKMTDLKYEFSDERTSPESSAESKTESSKEASKTESSKETSKSESKAESKAESKVESKTESKPESSKGDSQKVSAAENPYNQSEEESSAESGKVSESSADVSDKTSEVSEKSESSKKLESSEIPEKVSAYENLVSEEDESSYDEISKSETGNSSSGSFADFKVKEKSSNDNFILPIAIIIVVEAAAGIFVYFKVRKGKKSK